MLVTSLILTSAECVTGNFFTIARVVIIKYVFDEVVKTLRRRWWLCFNGTDYSC